MIEKDIMKFAKSFGCGALVSAVLGYVVWDLLKDVPEEVIGAERILGRTGLVYDRAKIDTRGDVNRIEFLDDDGYDVVINDDSTIVIGNVGYCIRPELRFAPKDELHTDNYGNTLLNNDYWCDTRFGKVYFKPLEENVKGNLRHCK